MARSEPPNLARCPDCDTVAIGSHGVECCDREMERLSGTQPPIEPAVEVLLETVFGIGETELDVCLCVMEHDGVTVAELADRLEFDRSVIARHLVDLVEIGVVERERRLLRQGGHVYVYTPVPEQVVRERLLSGFAGWVEDAVAELDAISREKIEAIPDRDRTGERDQQIFR